MNEIVSTVNNIIDFLNDDVYNLYRIYESYVRDLIISKKVNISAIIDNETEEEINDTIFQIITATNSAFVTIGVSKNKIIFKSFSNNVSYLFFWITFRYRFIPYYAII